MMSVAVRGGLLLLLCVGGSAEVPVKAGYGKGLVEGDIQVDNSRGSLALSSAGINEADRLWPGGVVPYFISTEKNPADHALTEDDATVAAAIAHWESNTCIRFQKCVEASCPTDHVMFISDLDQCNSPVGRNGGRNQINLAKDCGTGVAMQLIGHTLGLSHEQARNDRDEFVYVDYSQINSAMVHNFDKTGSHGRSIGAYDYGSIMHSGASEFAIGLKPTIVSARPIGQREKLSAGDISGIHFMYNDCKASYDKPACSVSQETPKRHVIPHSKPWLVEFNGLYSASMTLSYTGTTAPSSMLSQTQADGSTVSQTATAQVTFTPDTSVQGQKYTIQATFESGGKTATCLVNVEVASTDAVCFGKASNDPTVCGSRGTCQDNPLEPCKCNAGYGGLECLGFATCPSNQLDAFDDSIGTWTPFGVNVKKVSDFVAAGGGALLVGGQAQLSLLAESTPQRITFYMAWYDPNNAPTLSFRGDGGATCFQVGKQSGLWTLGGRSAAAQAAEKTYYHFDVHVNWQTQKADLYIDGHMEVQDVSFMQTCPSLSQVVYFGNGYLDEFHMWCTSYILLTGSLVEGMTQDDLRAGGTLATLTLVGDYDEWVDTTENKQRILDAMIGNQPKTEGWGKAKSTMLNTGLVKVNPSNRQQLVIGPLVAYPGYEMDPTELVDFYLTGQMFKSGQTPTWSARDVEFQVPGDCHHSVKKPFDTNTDSTSLISIDTGVMLKGAGSGKVKAGYIATLAAGGVRAKTITFATRAGGSSGQFGVEFQGQSGSIKCYTGIFGNIAYEVASRTTISPATANTWIEWEILIDWTAKTFSIKAGGVSGGTGIALPANFDNIVNIQISTQDGSSYIDELYLTCDHRDPTFEVKPTCPKVGVDAATLHFFPGSDALATSDKVALVPSSATDCSQAETQCASLEACSASTGSMLMDNQAVEWGAGTLPKLKGGTAYKVCYYPQSYKQWTLLKDTFTPCKSDTPETPAPATDAPSTDAPGTPAPGTDAPATDAPTTPAPVTSAPATDAPSTDAPGTPAPATPAPGTPAPVTPAPATDAPGTPAPGTPAPVTPAPSTPAPATPAPATPAPATDAPATPAPDTLAPTPLPVGKTEAPATPAPATPSPDTPAPATPAPSTPAPVTVSPVTAAPATPAPATDAPATPAPDTLAPTPLPIGKTVAPDTAAPDTSAPATPAPATGAPATDAPSTTAPATDAPATPAPATDAPATPAPDTLAPTPLPVGKSHAPDTPAPATPAPATGAPATPAPATDAPVTVAPATPAPATTAPMTDAPATPAPDTLAPTPLPAGKTHAPDTPAPATPSPSTPAPMTPAPATPAPATPAPATSAPVTDAPATPAPDTVAPTPLPAGKTHAPATPAPATPAPMTPAPATPAPATDAPATPAPDTVAPTPLPAGKTHAPATPAPATPAPMTSAPATPAPATDAPATPAPDTAAPTPLPAGKTHAPATPAPATDAPATAAPDTAAPTPLPAGKTFAPATPAPATDAPATAAPDTTAPTPLPSGQTYVPSTDAPETSENDTTVPDTATPRGLSQTSTPLGYGWNTTAPLNAASVDDGDSGFPWWLILIIAAGIIILCGVFGGIAWMMMRKNDTVKLQDLEDFMHLEGAEPQQQLTNYSNQGSAYGSQEGAAPSFAQPHHPVSI